MNQISRKTAIGIIGASGTAYKRTLPALEGSEICKVTAIQCRDLEKGNKIATEFNVPEVYQSVKEMVEHASFQVAYIATPPFRHLEDVQIAAEHHKDIICEKPLARNFDEGLEIADILKRFRNKFMLAHHLRHQPAICAIHRLLRDQIIGAVLNARFQWGYRLNKNAKNSVWKLNKSLAGGGSLVDVGSHCIDIALEFFGLPDSVYARFLSLSSDTVEDYASLALHYGSSDVFIDTLFNTAYAGNDLVIQGTGGLIKCHSFFGESATRNFTLYANNNKAELLRFPEVNPYRQEVEDFAKYLSGGAKAKPGIEGALDTMRIIQVAEVSAREGRRVSIDLTSSQRR